MGKTPSTFTTVLAEIIAESERAVDRFGTGSMSGPDITRPERLAGLGEEWGEVSREVNTELRNLSEHEPLRHGTFDPAKLIHELEQLASAAASWAAAERAGIVPPFVPPYVR